MMDSSSKFFFSFSVNYVMIVKLVDLIVLLGSKLLNHFRKIFNMWLHKTRSFPSFYSFIFFVIFLSPSSFCFSVLNFTTVM